MGHNEWKAVAAMLSGVAQLAAAVAAAWYFILRARRGHLIPNLSLLVTCQRVPSNQTGFDWLSIRVGLKKGERGTLGLANAQAQVSHGGTNQVVNLWGCLLAGSRNAIDW